MQQPFQYLDVMNDAMEESVDNQADKLKRLASLWMQAQPVVSAFIHGMVHQRHDVEDLVQLVAETCARKFVDFDEHGSQSDFRSWALTIARFEVLRYYQRQDRDKVGFRSELLETIANEFDRQSESPDHRLDALRKCLQNITNKNQQLIEMKYFREMSSDQIADRLAISAGAIRVALCRTRQVLAECIERRLEHGS